MWLVCVHALECVNKWNIVNVVVREPNIKNAPQRIVIVIQSGIKDLAFPLYLSPVIYANWIKPTGNILHLSNSVENKRNKIIAVSFVLLELDLNRLDGDTVCPPMRSGQDDLPGETLFGDIGTLGDDHSWGGGGGGVSNKSRSSSFKTTSLSH